MEHRKFLQRLDERVSEIDARAGSEDDRGTAAARRWRRGAAYSGSSASRTIPNAHTAARAALKAGAGRETACRAAAALIANAPSIPNRHVLAGLRKKERWLGFAEALNQSLPVRKAAKTCKVNKNTAFKWRHRFLKTQNQSKDRSLAGIAEVDEILLLDSFKGQRKLPRRRANAAALPKSQDYRLSKSRC